MATYRRKPIKTEAFQWTLEASKAPDTWPQWLNVAHSKSLHDQAAMFIDGRCPDGSNSFAVDRDDGVKSVAWGNWIILNDDGMLEECDFLTFPTLYGAVDDPQPTSAEADRPEEDKSGMIRPAIYPTCEFGRYRHVKQGGHYDVVAIAKVENTLEDVVVYQHAGGGQVWTRPHDEFFGGRFQRIDDAPTDAMPASQNTQAKTAPAMDNLHPQAEHYRNAMIGLGDNDSRLLAWDSTSDDVHDIVAEAVSKADEDATIFTPKAYSELFDLGVKLKAVIDLAADSSADPKERDKAQSGLRAAIVASNPRASKMKLTVRPARKAAEAGKGPGNIFAEIQAERAHQDKMTVPDNHHNFDDFVDWISSQADMANDRLKNDDAVMARHRMVQVGALTVAAIEWLDRKEKPQTDSADPWSEVGQMVAAAIPDTGSYSRTKLPLDADGADDHIAEAGKMVPDANDAGEDASEPAGNEGDVDGLTRTFEEFFQGRDDAGLLVSAITKTIAGETGRHMKLIAWEYATKADVNKAVGDAIKDQVKANAGDYATKDEVRETCRKGAEFAPVDANIVAEACIKRIKAEFEGESPAASPMAPHEDPPIRDGGDLATELNLLEEACNRRGHNFNLFCEGLGERRRWHIEIMYLSKHVRFCGASTTPSLAVKAAQEYMGGVQRPGGSQQTADDADGELRAFSVKCRERNFSASLTFNPNSISPWHVDTWRHAPSGTRTDWATFQISNTISGALAKAAAMVSA